MYFINYSMIRAKKVTFVFKNNFEANNGRGFEIYIICIYSETLKNNLINMVINDREKIKIIQRENPEGMYIYSIDINPLISTQHIECELPDNMIDCIIMPINIDSTVKLFSGYKIKNIKSILVKIICSKDGIYFEQ